MIMNKLVQTIFVRMLAMLPVFTYGQNITCDTATIYATEDTAAVCFEVVSNVRYCFSNNYPNHPDDYNQPQFELLPDDSEYSMCAYPDTNSYFTPLYETVETALGCTDTYIFGVLLNGVRLDPSSGSYFVQSDGSDNINWHVEASSSTNNTGQNMGTQNGGHLNAKDQYHYHRPATNYFSIRLALMALHTPQSWDMQRMASLFITNTFIIMQMM